MPNWLDEAGEAVRGAIGGMRASDQPSRFQSLLAARRQFDVRPASLDNVESGEVPAQAFLRFATGDGRFGTYYSNPLSAGAPVPELGLKRSMALYLPGDRGARRHETMHGIAHAARTDPSVANALPTWARGAAPGSFADELLARLAQRQPGSLLDWPMQSYKANDPLAYSIAMPVQSAARAVRDNPLAAAAAGAGAGVAAYQYGAQ
jgi:hypothetical protein